MTKILCVNPGSTSTKIAVFDDEQEVFKKSLQHTPEELARFSSNNDQIPWRQQLILDALVEQGIALEDIDAFAGRGGGLTSHEGGTYIVNKRMIDDAHSERYASHPALLACQICDRFSRLTGKPAFMTNSPATDEMRQIARITGMKGTYRLCSTHALNQKEVAARYAASTGRVYEDLNLVVCHIGGGISITAHKQGRMVDTNDNLNGDGPMAPTRCGTLPAVDVINLSFDAAQNGYSRRDVTTFVRSQGGLVNHLGTYDGREIGARIAQGDIYAKNVYDAMIYQIAKYVGSMYVALDCICDAIVLTGGIAHDTYVVGKLRSHVGKLAPIVVIPGEFEMEALAHGALDALRNGAKEYTGIPIWNESMLYESCEE